METLVELEALSFKYSGEERLALNNVSLRAKAGEYILLTGPSGCGKSTLARVLIGLIPHFYSGELNGKAIVAGYDIMRTPTYVLAKHVGLVFQDPENQLFLSNVEREIAFGLENIGLSAREIGRRVMKTMKELNIYHLKDKAPYELSGGQQQKVAIASVLAMEPEILILDEPTANLDPRSADEILGLIHSLVREKGILAILIEHRLELAAKYVSRIIIMNEGSIIADGDPRNVLLNPKANIIGVPNVVTLSRRMCETGIKLNKIPLTPHEFVSAVRSLVKNYERSYRS
ncbi:MAG: ABC transporter ATP-binding protein [Thermoprotei archaeon]|nr:MAG: ABC transporter ATP-binding protein [Thermoprotei archaeon]